MENTWYKFILFRYKFILFRYKFILFICIIIVIAISIMVCQTNAYYYGYKNGYVKSLVNQEKGLDHDFVLEETDNGEFIWIENKKLTKKDK